MQVSHLLISRGYGAHDDYDWLVTPQDVSDRFKSKMKRVFKIATRFNRRYDFDTLPPVYIFALSGTVVVITLSKTHFEDYQSRAIYALQGICIPEAEVSSLNVSELLQNRAHLDTLAQLEIDLSTDFTAITSPISEIDLNASKKSGKSLEDDADSLELDYSEEGFAEFMNYAANYDGTMHLLFGAPVEIVEALPEQQLVIASVNGSLAAKQVKAELNAGTPNPNDPLDRFNPVYQTKKKEVEEDEDKPFNLVDFIKSFLD